MQQIALRICRETFEEFVRKGDVPPLPEPIPEDLSHAMCGVYVAAFEKPGKIPRGHVGSPFPTKPSVAEEIQIQTIRLIETFPFRKEDLPFLSYQLVITHPPQLLPCIEDLPPEKGLLIRSHTGTWVASLPSEKNILPNDRFRETISRGSLKGDEDDLRLYWFNTEVICEE